MSTSRYQKVTILGDPRAVAEQPWAPLLPTVSSAFVQDWLVALQAHCTPPQLRRFLAEVDLELDGPTLARVTHDQIVRLYQLVAVETGDEMMGLWSRPIRSGALKHLCTSVRGASSLSAALFRFVTFWNLLLDDHQLALDDDGSIIRVTLTPEPGVVPQRFGHMLMLKLAHGIASWLVGEELELAETVFAFDRPDFAEDYPILFPLQVGFGADRSVVGFNRTLGRLPVDRTDAEMYQFLVDAPRDWIFTSHRQHTLALRVRELLLSRDLDGQLVDTARLLNLSPRTLMRRLDAEQTSFQRIHDGVRRDIAIRELAHSDRSIESIAHQVGFTSAPNFHRAFKRWTGSTPGSYRSS
jgi:AraC-like DNA-binding protein